MWHLFWKTVRVRLPWNYWGGDLAKVMEMDAVSGDAARLADGFDAAWECALAEDLENGNGEAKIQNRSRHLVKAYEFLSY